MTSTKPQPKAKPKLPTIEPFYDIPNVAEVLGLSDKSVRRRIAAGEIRIHRFGRQIRVARDDLTAYITRHRE